MFGKSKQINTLVSMLDEEHRKRQAARRKIKELEKLLSESESRNDSYCVENTGLRRRLSLALTGEEKEKLLAENKKLAEENAGMRRWNESLLRFNDTLDLVNRRMAKKATKSFMPPETEIEAYKAENAELRKRIAELEKERKEEND